MPATLGCRARHSLTAMPVRSANNRNATINCSSLVSLNIYSTNQPHNDNIAEFVRGSTTIWHPCLAPWSARDPGTLREYRGDRGCRRPFVNLSARPRPVPLAWTVEAFAALRRDPHPE